MRLLLVLAVLSNVAFAAADPLPWSPLPAKVPTPANNPTTKEKVHLGKQLFFDPRLSLDGTVSCNSCHNVMSGGTDSRPFSVGVSAKVGGRSAPTVWNAAFHTVQFWDGRAATLEDQAIGPMTNPVEMAMASHDVVMARVAQIPGYVEGFKKAFKGEANPVTITNAAKAIAAYERTLITRNSPFDKYMKGNKKAISAQAEKGMRTVIELGCITCHRGSNFNGELAMGEGFYQKFPLLPDEVYTPKYKLTADKGRGDLTKNEEDNHFWRVPTWRNVAITAPYFHNGSVASLEEAVRVMAKVQLGKDVSEDQVKDIVAFLNTLTGEFPEQTMPRLPETPGKSFF